MVTRRPPRMLPGSDPLVIHKIFIPIYLCMAVVSLGLAMALAALDAREGQSWHLPWPIVQWALTTPLGILAMTLVGGLVGGLSSVVAAAAILGGQFAYAVDVTELRRTLVAELALVPFLLMTTGLYLLGAWLPTQWIPN